MSGYNPVNTHEWWASRKHADMKEWTRVSAEMTELVGKLSDRESLVAVVEPGVGKGAPAVYIPEQAHVEIDSDVCAEGEDPADIHLDTEAGQLRHAKLVGAGGHEAAHGDRDHGSHWTIDQDWKKRPIVAAALGIEESRIEKYHLIKHPERRVFLRATFHELVNKQKDPIESIRGAAHMAALTGGRVDAGVLDASEAEPIIRDILTVLGPEVYDKLRAVWLEAHTHMQPDQDTMEALGQRWVDILKDAGAEEEEIGEGTTVVFVCNDPGDQGDGESGDGESILKQVAEAISDAAEQEAKGQRKEAENRDAAAERDKEAKEAEKDEKAAEQTFSKVILVGHGWGRGHEGIAAERHPNDVEVAQANVLAAKVKRAQFRDYAITSRATALPPGRLDGSKALKRSAEISMGLPPKTKQWKRTKRTFVEKPPFIGAVACDISGSMSSMTEAVASAAWVVAQAVHRNDGDFAAVAYGERVHPIVMPREKPRMVRDFNANGGMENWTGAMRSLNGALQLDQPRGVRMLVFISDGHYTHTQRAQGDVMLRKLMRSGVKVLWIGFRGKGNSGGDIVPDGAEYVHLTDTSQMGTIIGQSMVRLLERA